MSRARANGEGSIYPYRNGYAAYVWVTKPNGKRARKYVYGQTREIVHDKWIKLQHRASAGPVATSVPTLGEYAAAWLEDVVKPNLAPTTYAKYETFTRLYIVPGLGAKRLDRLTVRDVQRWLNQTAELCQCCVQGKDSRRDEPDRKCCAREPRECCHDVPAQSTVRSIRECLRSMLSAAARDDLITRNVAALTRLPSVRTSRTKAWTSDQARRFLEDAREHRDRLYAAYVLVLVLGLRKGEVLGLTWTDVDLDNGQLIISHQLQRVGRQLLHRRTKTSGSEAVLPLPEICVTALAQRRTEQRNDHRNAGEVWEDHPFVFTGRYGSPIDPRTFNRVFNKRCERAGVPIITVHDARRTCATLLVDLDVHPRIIMQILRHARFALTMEIYSRVTPQQTREALRRLSEHLGSRTDV